MSLLYSIFPLGDAALTVDFGNRINDDINNRVLQLFSRLQNSSPFVKDLVPAYSSLTIYYDALSLRSNERSAFEAMKGMIEPLLREEEKAQTLKQRKMRI